MTESEATKFWEDRYGGADKVWSGRVNRSLAVSVADLHPGRALDLGCGEGADSIWLAGRGWQVSGVDISSTAIGRAKEAAEAAGIPTERIDWLIQDLAEWSPDQSYDLVSACFLHSPLEFPRAEVLRRAASAVAPMGHLLVVSHGAFPPWSAHNHEYRFLSPAEEIENLQLPQGRWETVTAETRPREATAPSGEIVVIDDVIVLLRRLS